MMNFKQVFFKIWKKIKRYYFFKKNNIKIARGSFISLEATIGRYTRINATSHIGVCDIGSFCAIGGRLIVRSSDHYLAYLNMQDFFQSTVLKSKVKVAGKIKNRVTIGHGVWIGDSVVVLSGASIGNGAVIGAGSIVTKAIPPYSVAVGNPARVIKYRFKKEVIDIIEQNKWWQWDIEKLKRNKFIFEESLESITPDELNSLFNSVLVK
jgi:virginiamycin A acetyltransferase